MLSVFVDLGVCRLNAPIADKLMCNCMTDYRCSSW